jgi:hypothetical protein
VEADPGAQGASQRSGVGRSTDSAPRTSQAGARILELFEDRSPIATTCPFLRSDFGAGLAPPIEHPAPANRCAALDEPQLPSARQQELVCLTAAHVNCPRYLRGSVIARQTALGVPHARTLTGAIFGAILILIASSAASFGFVLTRGGLDIPVASPRAPEAAVALPTAPPATPEPTVVAVEPSPVTITPQPSIAPSVQPSIEPTSTPTAPSTKPSTRPAATPRPTSDRFAVLDRCPNRSDCWIYTIRAGDNLFSIAHWFGVSLDRIYAMNPWTRSQGIRAGQELLIPTPTR